MSTSEMFYLETVDTREEAQAAQLRHVCTLSSLGFLPGPTVGYKEVMTATGKVFQLYMRHPERESAEAG